jgi:hypothetical protein
MRSDFQKSNGLGALFECNVDSFSENEIKTFKTCVFGHQSDLNGHYELQKQNVFVKWMSRTNEATRRIVFYPNSAQNKASIKF